MLSLSLVIIPIYVYIIIKCIEVYRKMYTKNEHFKSKDEEIEEDDDKGNGGDEEEETSEQPVPQFKDNIVNIYDDKGVAINAALVVAPMNTSDKKNYETYKDEIIFLGMTSYLEFPNIVSNKLDVYNDKNHESWKFDYKNNLEGWFYCFKDPENYFSPNKPRLLLSESDFADEQTLKPDTSVKKKYDFIYICHKTDKDEKKCVKDDWVAYNKSLDLAFDCINIMCTKFKLKGLIVGRKGCEALTICKKSLEFTDKLEWNDLVTKYKETKFIFIPSIADASPRVITEALCLDLPIIVNKNILGGWKYVNEQTGVFFNDLNDFEYNLGILLKNMDTYTPRQYFIDNYGVVRSGERMLQFMRQHFSNKLNISNECRYLMPRFVKKDYQIQQE